MQTYHHPHLPPHLRTVHLALFTNVQNAAALRVRLVHAATAPGSEGEAEREAVNYAFVDARLITSVRHLKSAIYHAALAASHNALRTKYVHSEIIWTLNPTNNITEALRRYGVSANTTSLFVVRVDQNQEQGEEPEGFVERLRDVVHGELVPLSHLETITDWETIKKHYKLNNEPAVRNAGDRAAERRLVDRIVTSSVATKLVAG